MIAAEKKYPEIIYIFEKPIVTERKQSKTVMNKFKGISDGPVCNLLNPLFERCNTQEPYAFDPVFDENRLGTH